MKKLEVFFWGWGQNWLLGTLADNGTDLLFEYSPQALAQGIELSPRMLKLRAGAFGDFPVHQHRLPGLIADALPDGWGMLLMERLFVQQGIERSRISPLDRLAFLGERTMGALVFKPAANLALAPAAIELLELARQARAVIAGQESAALKQLILLGGSPHGARPKVLVLSPVFDVMPPAQLAGVLHRLKAFGTTVLLCTMRPGTIELDGWLWLGRDEQRRFASAADLNAFLAAREAARAISI